MVGYDAAQRPVPWAHAAREKKHGVPAQRNAHGS
jgi:hypothetical protein